MRWIIIIGLLLMSELLKGQESAGSVDTLQTSAFEPRDWGSAVIPLAQGLAATAGSSRFRERGAVFARHGSPLWEYGPGVAPLATTWVLKSAGVESRSTTRRMALAQLTGLGLQTGLSQLLKHTVCEVRPDGSDDESFPSGHSSLAFFCATVLDYEYGHHSPWISVGGYSLAVLTQFRRIHHNRHYVNDVVTGAGIGILSAHLGYFITDRLFRVRGERQATMCCGDSQFLAKYNHRPTSLSLSSGLLYGYNGIPHHLYDVSEDARLCHLRTTVGYSTSLTYDYFLDSHWAVETMGMLSQYKVQALSERKEERSEVNGNNLYQYHLTLGGLYSLTIGRQSRLGVRAFAGGRFSPGVAFKGPDGETAVRLKSRNDFEYGCGLNYELSGSSRYVSGLSCDYIHACSPLLRSRWQLGTYWRIML